MSDPSKIRQEPTDDRFISNGDPMQALHWVDRFECGIDGTTRREVSDALRFWIGEAAHLREQAGGGK